MSTGLAQLFPRRLRPGNHDCQTESQMQNQAAERGGVRASARAIAPAVAVLLWKRGMAGPIWCEFFFWDQQCIVPLLSYLNVQIFTLVANTVVYYNFQVHFRQASRWM